MSVDEQEEEVSEEKSLERRLARIELAIVCLIESEGRIFGALAEQKTALEYLLSYKPARVH